MKTDSLREFVKLRSRLHDERTHLQSRLAEINHALGEMPLPSLSAVQGAVGARGRRNGTSLREHVLEVLKAGPKTKEEVLEAVQRRGYKFTTSNPLNSLGVILYGTSPKLKRVDGRFSLSGRASATAPAKAAPPAKKRRMSAAGRKAIADAARKRWAAAKAAGKKRL